MRWTLVVALVLVPVSSAAAVRTGSTMQIEKEVLDGAGGEVTSTSYILTSVVAQPHAGYSESASYITSTGFLHPMNAPGNTPPSLGAVTTPEWVDEGGVLQITLSATDGQSPPQVLTYGMSGAPANSSLDPGTGVFTYAPDFTQGGSVDTVTFEVSDGNGGRDSQDVDIYTINTDGAGDLDGDLDVDGEDMAIILANHGLDSSYPTWDPRADPDGNNLCNMFDLWVVCVSWNTTY